MMVTVGFNPDPYTHLRDGADHGSKFYYYVLEAARGPCCLLQ